MNKQRMILMGVAALAALAMLAPAYTAFAAPIGASNSASAPALLANWYYPALQAAPAQSRWTSKPASPVTAPGSAVNWYYQP
jgi:hypothetical protein